MDDASRLAARARIVFVAVVLALALFAVWSAGDFRRAARLFPQYGGAALAILCALELVIQLLRRSPLGPPEGALNTSDIGLEADEATREGWLRSLAMLGWVFGYIGLIFLLGMPLATAVFVPALLWLRFGAAPWIAPLLVLGLWGLMWALRAGLALRLPPGWLTGTFPF